MARGHLQLNAVIADKNLEKELEKMKVLLGMLKEKIGYLQNVSMIQEGLYAQAVRGNESSF